MAPFWHRWSDFLILNLSVFHLTDKWFAVSNLINLRTILFLEYRNTPETKGFWGILRLDTTLSCDNKSIFRLYYSMIVATRPDPTVRPPSRIANVRPCSIATGWIMSIVISTLSPGMHISVPSGRVITPVTSVVRK